jgi:phosphate:Na+ symporter
MSLSQSVGVIMGANIGTTITAQIVAFKITKAALGMIAVGFAMLFLAKNEKIKALRRHADGPRHGVLRHACDERGDAAVAQLPALPRPDADDGQPARRVLISTAFTALIQSSSATTGYRHRHGFSRVSSACRPVSRWSWAPTSAPARRRCWR